MNGNEVIDLARRTYLEEFARFVAKQAARFEHGAAEVATSNTKAPSLFGGHYRVDFIGQSGKDVAPVDLIPDNRVRLDGPLEGVSGAMRVRMEQIVWDDVAINHDAAGDLSVALKPWFDHWYDPDDRRKPTDSGGATDVIHSLGVLPGQLLVDFGTASPSAFWALIGLLRDAGAANLVIQATRQETREETRQRPSPPAAVIPPKG